MPDTFFETFTPQEVARISAAGTHLTLPAGWSPIWENTPADKAYIILDGQVSIRRDGEEVARLGAGDIVGESAIVGHRLRSATVVALSELELIHLTTEAVQRLCTELPTFREALDAVAAARLR